MRKLLTFFVAILATTALLAQNYDFQVGDLKYRVTSAEEPYTVEVVGCAPDVASVEIPSTVAHQAVAPRPELEAPGAGKVTICVQVIEPLCEGSMVVIPGFLTSWDTGDAIANGQATQLVEGTNNWYAGTFDWQPDYTFKIAHCRPSGMWDWQYQAASGKVLEGDVTPNDGITDDMAINSDNQVIYIRVDAWEASACEKLNEAGTATFNLTTIGFPAEAQFAVAGSGLLAGAWACPPPAEHIMTNLGEGQYTLTLDVPAEFQYKYLVDLYGDGSWQWFSFANYNMPLSLVTNDTERYDAWSINGKKDIISSENDKNTITYTIIGIGDYAFDYCSSLMSVTIPNTVKYVGYNAFGNCYSLLKTNFTGNIAEWCAIQFARWGSNPMKQSKNLYINNVKLQGELVIPNSVEYVGDHTFAYCEDIDAIQIPSSVVYIGTGAFAYCPSITSITISEGVEFIGEEAFSYCSALQYLSIPSSVQYSVEIFEDFYGKWTEYYNGVYSILGCDNLKTLIVPADFFGVNDYQYAKSDLLPYLPEKLEALTINGGNMDHRFGWDFINRNRKSLKHIDFGATESIAEEAFLNFYNLESLILPSTIETIPYMAVAECVKLQSITIPAAVTEIEDRAFENCRMLSSVNFAKDGALTRIGNWAFYNNHELTNLVIPEGVTEVGHAAFYGCTYLAEMTLPSTVQEIADNGFALCAKLRRMNVDAMLPPTVAARTFEEVDRSIPVYVPDEVVDIYKAAPVWQEFNIQGKSNAPTGVENTHSPSPMTDCQKVIHNGQLLILRDGKTYNVMGQAL